MDKKYTVKDFCKKYIDAKNVETRGILVKSIMCVDYIPYERKITICEKIIESTYYTKDANGIKKMHINSPAQYMLYCLNLVNEYTSIKVDFSASLEEFNLLNKNGLLDMITSFLHERELKEFRMILDMVKSDTMQNECEIHSFIRGQVERFGELIGTVIEPVFEQLNEAVKNMDEKTINKLINKFKN